MKTNVFKYLFFIIVILLLILAIYLLYKEGKEKNTDIHASKLEINMIKELNIGITEYDTINPILSNNRDIQYVDKLIFESLLDITYDFKIQNLLAKEFSKINTTTYLVKLKEDVYWHDGVNFTAKDVIFTINNLKKDNINSIYKENVSKIKEIEEIDNYTIKITLTEEMPFFEYMMCFPILASHAYEEETLESKTKNLIGTGKYKISEVDENVIKIIKSNNQSNSKIEKINLMLTKSVQDLYISLIKKEIDLMITDNIEYENYIGTMGYNVNSSCNREYEYLALNTKENLLSQKEIRQAIFYAIDRKSINYNIYNNKYTINNFPIDYGSYLYNESEHAFEYNINKAKSILVENGWTYKNNSWNKKNSKLQFNLIVNESNNKRIFVAKEIKEQLNKVGIIINIKQVNNYTYNQYLKNKNYDIILTGNIVSNCPNIETYLGKDNLSNYNNNNIEYIFKEIKNIDNQDLIKDKYLEIMRIYKEEIPFISLCSNSLFVLSNTDLKGDLSHNWYNIFYNIDNWYKVEE